MTLTFHLRANNTFCRLTGTAHVKKLIKISLLLRVLIGYSRRTCTRVGAQLLCLTIKATLERAFMSRNSM